MTTPQKKKREEAQAEISEEDHRKRMAALSCNCVVCGRTDKDAVCVNQTDIEAVHPDPAKLRQDQSYGVPGADPGHMPPAQPIAKPAAFSLNAFKSSRNPSVSGVETLQTALDVMKISGAKDFVRLHPDEANYWSDELCFVNVPVLGHKAMSHLITEPLAKAYLSDNQVLRHGLALAAKPGDKFFLCIIPTQNLVGNLWNSSNVDACRAAKELWTQAISRHGEGQEGYLVRYAKDPKAFDEPNWPTQTLDELIGVTFKDRVILDENHPGLLRLIGARQSSE